MTGAVALSSHKFMPFLSPLDLDKLSKCKDCVCESLVTSSSLRRKILLLLRVMVMLVVVVLTKVLTIIDLVVVPIQVNLKNEIKQFSQLFSCGIHREPENMPSSSCE